MLSLVLSFLLYGHTLNAIQSVGLCLAIVAMIANFYEKVCIRRDALAVDVKLDCSMHLTSCFRFLYCNLYNWDVIL